MNRLRLVPHAIVVAILGLADCRLYLMDDRLAPKAIGEPDPDLTQQRDRIVKRLSRSRGFLSQRVDVVEPG